MKIGKKISKSKQGQGGYEKPQTSEAYVKKWGADVVRLWVASQDYRNDIVVSEKRIEKVSETLSHYPQFTALPVCPTFSISIRQRTWFRSRR